MKAIQCICQSNIWSYIESTFLEMEFNHFPNLEWTVTPWDTIDPYLRGGLPLVDLVDLLTCIGEVLGSLGLLASALAEGTVSQSSVPSLCGKGKDISEAGHSLICILP